LAVVNERHIASLATVTMVPAGKNGCDAVPPGP
jgi:hypothetical protein